MHTTDGPSNTIIAIGSFCAREPYTHVQLATSHTNNLPMSLIPHSHTGGHITPEFSKSNTHLMVNVASGKKYETAVKWGVPAVSSVCVCMCECVCVCACVRA